MASGSSRLSGALDGTGRAALLMPPSITKWATWMPLGDSSRAIDCASPRRANLPMAKLADSAKPFTPAVAPVAGGGRGAERGGRRACGVVAHAGGGRPACVESREQACNFLRIGGVAGMNLGAGLLRKCSELVGLAGSQ